MGGYSPATPRLGKAEQIELRNTVALRRDLDRIATALVGTLTQLDGFEPLSITIQATPPTTELGEAIVRQLRRVGYGLQKVKEDQGRNYISYARTEIISDTGFIVLYSITVSDVTIARQFSETGAGIMPVSPFAIEGVEPQYINPASDPYFADNRLDVGSTGAIFELADGSKVRADNRSASNNQVDIKSASLAKLIEIHAADTINIKNYRTIREVRITFPSSDDRILGESNKRTLRELARELVSAQEILTLADCSSGSSGADLQRRSLSWQKRIKQELLSAGIDKEAIHSTACEGRSVDTRVLQQSVVVTLRSLKKPN